MSERLIFVSCGQLTEEEKSLGLGLRAVIDDAPGLKAYFAEAVQDLSALSQHVLSGIQQCVGAVVVLHDRGIVIDEHGEEWGHRSSVWVYQEVAVLAYRQFFESNQIPILAFADKSVKLEGAMTSLIVNPLPLGSRNDVLAAVKAWIAQANFGYGSSGVFDEKWGNLSDSTRVVVAALLREGGHRVKESSIRQTLINDFGLDREVASTAVQQARGEFVATGLVELVGNTYSGSEMSVHPTWEFSLRRESDRRLMQAN